MRKRSIEVRFDQKISVEQARELAYRKSLETGLNVRYTACGRAFIANSETAKTFVGSDVSKQPITRT